MSQPAATLQADTPVVQVGESQTVQVGLLASANSSAVISTGTSTTGSYMRDLMRALATIGSLTSSQVTDSGFQALMQDTSTSLRGVVSAMADDDKIGPNLPREVADFFGGLASHQFGHRIEAQFPQSGNALIQYVHGIGFHPNRCSSERYLGEQQRTGIGKNR